MLEWKIHPFPLISPLKTPEQMKLTTKAVVNRSRACPPLFLPAVFLEGLPTVFVAGWPADHLMTAPFT